MKRAKIGTASINYINNPLINVGKQKSSEKIFDEKRCLKKNPTLYNPETRKVGT